jgi:hypothetical protein
MPNYFFSLARCICRTIMAEESDQPQKTQPGTHVTAQSSGETRPAEQGRSNQQQSGQRRHDRRDRNPGQGRHPGGQRHHFRRDHPPRHGQQEKPPEASGKAEDIDSENEETERDRSSTQRRHHRGGRPPKKIIEEWANDIYCE